MAVFRPFRHGKIHACQPLEGTLPGAHFKRRPEPALAVIWCAHDLRQPMVWDFRNRRPCFLPVRRNHPSKPRDERLLHRIERRQKNTAYDTAADLSGMGSPNAAPQPAIYVRTLPTHPHLPAKLHQITHRRANSPSMDYKPNAFVLT